MISPVVIRSRMESRRIHSMRSASLMSVGSPMWSAPCETKSRFSASVVPTEGCRDTSGSTFRGPPAGLLLDLAGRGDGRILVGVDVAAGKFPYPAIDDEAMPPHHQHVLSGVVENHHHRGLRHPQDVLLELHPVG